MIPFVGAPGRASAALADRGRFLIFIGGDQVGVEDFELTKTSARSHVEISVGGQASRAQVELALSPQMEAESYRLEAPGTYLKVAFEEDTAKFEAPGVSRRTKVCRPRVVLDNNVFSHYQLLLGMYDHSRGGVQSFMAVLPTTNAADASVSVTMELLGPGRPRRQARANVDADAKPDAGAEARIPLTEYKIILAGVIGVSVFADGAGRVMYVEVPGQNGTAVREEYQRAIEKAADRAKPARSAGPSRSAALAKSATSAASAAPAALSASVVPDYVDQDVVVKSAGDVRLAGTFTLPLAHPDQGVRYPAVVLISGSGPQDRDGNTPPSYQTFIFRRIAERLASCGIAVLRYDDRGVGTSTGDFESAGLFDLAGDARAMVASVKGYPNIDPARIGVIGHSEGAYIASMLAGEDPQIAACVLLAGASTTLDRVMVEQIEYQATFDELDEASRSLAAGLLPAVKQLIQDARDGKSRSAVSGNLQWLREHMQIDPVGQIRAIKAPILIVQGEKDLKVKPYHAQVLAEAARSAGNRSVTLVRLPNTTHEFLEWPYRNPNFDPMDPMRVVEGLLATVQGWLVSTL